MIKHGLRPCLMLVSIKNQLGCFIWLNKFALTNCVTTHHKITM